jgi:hypothetical protein
MGAPLKAHHDEDAHRSADGVWSVAMKTRIGAQTVCKML